MGMESTPSATSRVVRNEYPGQIGGIDADIFLKREEECLAACCGAPMMMVDHEYVENLTPEKVDAVLEELK